MRSLATFVTALAVGAALAIPFFAPAVPPAHAQNGPPAACPDRLVADQTSLVCACSSAATATGGVWGSDVYTDDSAICRAALHAGIIGTRGGIVWVREDRGRDAYPAVTRNSVASSSWGQWGRSISFGNPDQAGAMPGACPANAASLDIGAMVQCVCPAEATASGSVWGVGPYTADSAICRAALQAGAVDTNGGEVMLHVTTGQASYPAGTRNGVASSSWGSFPKSFRFGD